jgi:hypothetical protein
MLARGKEALEEAFREGYAIGAFLVYNLEGGPPDDDSISLPLAPATERMVCAAREEIRLFARAGGDGRTAHSLVHSANRRNS